MKPSNLLEGLKQLLATLEEGNLLAAGELSKSLAALPFEPAQLAEARAIHARCQALSQTLYDKLRTSVESTGRARRATDAYQDVR